MKHYVRLTFAALGLAFVAFVASILYAGWTSYRELPETSKLRLTAPS
jgi:hypothetical protein